MRQRSLDKQVSAHDLHTVKCQMRSAWHDYQWCVKNVVSLDYVTMNAILIRVESCNFQPLFRVGISQFYADRNRWAMCFLIQQRIKRKYMVQSSMHDVLATEICIIYYFAIVTPMVLAIYL